MMTVNAIDPLLSLVEPLTTQATTQAQEVAPSNFGKWFASEMNAVNDKLVKADNDIQQLATGQTQNLHETMIRIEEARLSFQLLLQVRNRVLEAYQEVMRTQV